MGLFKRFTSPRDPRWQGPQHHHHTIFLVKNFILLLFIILIVVEYKLFITWWRYDGLYKNNTGHLSIKHAPYHFWLCIGLALIPDVIYTLITISLMFQIPSLSIRARKLTFHPVVALTFSLAFFGLYVFICWSHILLIYSNEIYFYNLKVWYKIGYAEVGLQAALMLCYIGMTAFSCVAVHRWR